MSLSLNRKATETAIRIQSRQTKSARWIASEVLRELNSKTVQDKLRTKKEKQSP